MSNQTIISFDYGTKKTGIAIGQSLLGTAQPLCTISTVNHLPELNALDKLIQEWQPNLAVIGLPATAQKPFIKRVKKLQQSLLQRYTLESVFVDETLTTEQANYELHASGTKKNRKAASRDQIAARLILETYFSMQ